MEIKSWENVWKVKKSQIEFLSVKMNHQNLQTNSLFFLPAKLCRLDKVKNLISQVLFLLVLISWSCSVSWWKASDVTPAKVMVPPHMVQHTEQHPGADTGHDTDHQQYSVTWCDLGMRYKWKIITKYNWLKLSAASWTTFLSKLSTTAPL